MVAVLACLPSLYPDFGWAYYLGVTGIALLLLYEHAIVRPDDLTRVNQAFFNVNAVVSIGLLVIGSLDLLI
jgi:4-hydroxybenzoate polyprenyltransferase